MLGDRLNRRVSESFFKVEDIGSADVRRISIVLAQDKSKTNKSDAPEVRPYLIIKKQSRN